MQFPEAINVVDFCYERLPNIRNWESFLNQSDIAGVYVGSKHDERKASNSLRRRTTSHRRRNIPCRKRMLRGCQRRGGVKETSHDRCRKHKRRPKQIKNLHHTRDETYNILETHFWHRKRMHFTLEWGWCLPCSHFNRSMKFLHKAMESSSVIYDESYYTFMTLTAATNEATAQILQLFMVHNALFIHFLNFIDSWSCMCTLHRTQNRLS